MRHFEKKKIIVASIIAGLHGRVYFYTVVNYTHKMFVKLTTEIIYSQIRLYNPHSCLNKVGHLLVYK
jgi:hypothetical protein